jgi:hypothetical protein
MSLGPVKLVSLPSPSGASIKQQKILSQIFQIILPPQQEQNVFFTT